LKQQCLNDLLVLLGVAAEVSEPVGGLGLIDCGISPAVTAITRLLLAQVGQTCTLLVSRFVPKNVTPLSPGRRQSTGAISFRRKAAATRNADFFFAPRTLLVKDTDRT
jgi:hypothetical protein